MKNADAIFRIRFAFAAAMVMLLACLAVAHPVQAQMSSSDWYNRGLENYKKGDLDDAIADYNRAIELNPEFADAYYKRGLLKSYKGDLDGGIADYSRAIELGSKSAKNHSNRGIAFQVKGKFDQAVADFKNAIELNKKDDYGCLNLLACTWLAKGDSEGAADKLRKHILANDSDKWVRTISKYYLGMDNLNEQAVIAVARKGKDGKEVGERLCQAYYYLGVKRLVAGNRKGAAEYFTLNIETEVRDFIEFAASKAMLALMKEGKI